MLILALLALLSGAAPASAAPVLTTEAVLETVNAIRRAGCAQHSGLDTALRAEPRLDTVALLMMQGRSLAQSMARAAYRPTSASALRIRIRDGDGDRASLQRLLRQQFCVSLADAAFREVGTASRGPELWIVLAAPFAPPAAGAADAVGARVLELVNDVRSRGQRCGPERFGPAAPLARSAALQRAAATHARTLAAMGELTHRASDGSRSSDRATREGYEWSAVAENLAAGPTTADEVVNGWLGSPSHCTNLMNPRFTEMGIAYVVAAEDPAGIYWVQVLAAPRRAF